MTDTSGEHVETGNERFAFEAEVSRLLNLVIHSVYSEKEVFLRELISNAADACDKLRYAAVTEPDLMSGDADLAISIVPDAEAKTLSIADNGIGMSRDELIHNLGTIAHSGTFAFLKQLEKSEEEAAGGSLIGKFGVGFYSAFIVASRVEVRSRRAGSDEAWLWYSNSARGFGVEPLAVEEAPQRGTVVTLHLKKDAQDFLQPHELERLVRTYSDHVPFPIQISEGEGEPRQVNKASALWAQPKSDLNEDAYKEFYSHVSGQFDEPAVTIHYRAEGRHEYTVLLFIPTMRPFDLFDMNRKGRVKLYVRRVFITDEAELLPAYLRFVRGVIDSEDMPLNISREMLQNNPIVASIRKAVTNRVLSELKKLADGDNERFVGLWDAFGQVIKEGLYEDPERRDMLFEIARFRSTAGEGWRSLKDYVADMRENQTEIFYLIGEQLEQLRSSPQIEGFRARGVEVLLLCDPVDNFWVTTALGFDGKPFRSITQGDIDLSAVGSPADEGGEEAAPTAGAQKDDAVLVARLKTVYGDTLSDVRCSKRLVTSPACLVAAEGGPDRGLDRMLERQSLSASPSRPVLEINAGHPLLRNLAELPAGGAFEDLAWVVLDQARILEGEPPINPSAFAERLNRLLAGLQRQS